MPYYKSIFLANQIIKQESACVLRVRLWSDFRDLTDGKSFAGRTDILFHLADLEVNECDRD